MNLCLILAIFETKIKNIWGESDDFQLWRYVDDKGNPTTIHVDDSDVTFNICLGISFQGKHLTLLIMIEHYTYTRHTTHSFCVPGSQLRFYGVARKDAQDVGNEDGENPSEKEKGSEEGDGRGHNEEEAEEGRQTKEGDEGFIEYQQQPGRTVVHLGANRHEVFPIAEGGLRYNLILWCRKG